MKRSTRLFGLIVFLFVDLIVKADDPVLDKKKELAALTWTDPVRAAAEDADYSLQGEYGSSEKGAAWGVQVVALGGGSFEAYVLEGGLPGLGWSPQKSRVRLSGTRTDDIVRFASEDKSITAVIRNGSIAVSRNEKVVAELRRTERKSPTLGAKPADGAIVLFDGSSADAWQNGKVENGLLVNNDVATKDSFTDYTLHLEFRTPYKPYARGQARGNSGVYHQGRYETQVLDSFGLEGKMDETGGIYSISAPSLNMCLPPLTWQTYDIDFTADRFEAKGELKQHAKLTVRLNGVVVQENRELPQTTPAARIKKVTQEPGPLFLQHHNNPVYYRNIWLVPKVVSAKAVAAKKLLVVTVTEGFRHGPAIAAAERVLPKLSALSGGELEFEFLSEPSPRPNAGPAPKRGEKMTDQEWAEKQSNYSIAAAKAKTELVAWTAKVNELFQSKFSPASLNSYDGVIFCNTTGDLPLPNGEAFTNWVSKGKAFIGMHAATDTLKAMPSYFEMINGSFAGHPWGAGGTYHFVNHEPTHPTVAMFESEFQWKDEIYQYNHFNPESVHVLLSLDTGKSKPQAPYHVPVAWVRNVGSGRLFYTSLGHNPETWDSETYQKHIVAGIRWALKLAEGPSAPNPEISSRQAIKSLVGTASTLLKKDLALLEKKALAKAVQDPKWAAKLAAEADSYRTMANREARSGEPEPAVSRKMELLTKLVDEIER